MLDVSAANAAGEKHARSRPTALVVALPPSNVEPPTISGTARLESTLSADRGRWIGLPEPTFDLEWRRCDLAGPECVPIDQATAAVYTLTRSDVGKAIVLRVTATNRAGPVTMDTTATQPVEGAPLSLELPTFSGRAIVGERLTANPGSWSAFPEPEFGYRWLRCDAAGENCGPAHALRIATIPLNPSDAGHTFRVEVTASNALGEATARSTASAPVRRPPFNIALPFVEYDFEAETFTADPGEWRGYPAPSYTFRWQHCKGTTCWNIQDAPTESKYTPEEGQPGCDIRVVVTATNNAGSTTATSETLHICD